MPGEVDICLFLEGTYPYVTGGVSQWTHELIQTQPDLSFYLICLLPPNATPKFQFELPKNVVGKTDVFLQKIPSGKGHFSAKERKELFKRIELPILNIEHNAKLQHLKQIIDAFQQNKHMPGKEILMESYDAWNMVLRMYNSTMGDSSFLNYFWSWKGLLSGLYSVLLADYPLAKVYHSLCTGYAGLFLARSHLETGRPCLLTEHGIYSNERRIEITAAQWLNDMKAMDLSVNRPSYIRDLKDFWVDTFTGYSKLCYEASSKIVTLYEGNTDFQVMDGADPTKIKIIPNGVDFVRFSKIKKDKSHPPTMALIGRVVPIKDIKNYIHATALVREKIPELRSFILGSQEEDVEYVKECKELVSQLGLDNVITFTGNVKVDDYMPEIDVMVLTSISEVQPLSVLEAGSCGIPSVTTNVGSCSELIYGRSDEEPKIGPAGAVCPLANPHAIAEEVYQLLAKTEYYEKCSQSIRERVAKYYTIQDQQLAYQILYNELMRK